MSNAAHALAPVPAGEDDYQAFYAVLAASARGRAFLDEHARRHRHADTEMLLGALRRLEGQIAAQTPRPPQPVPAEIAAVLETVRSARAEVDAVRLAGAVTQLVSALDAVQRKLAPLIAGLPAAVSEPTPAQAPFALAITAVAAQALARAEAEEESVRVFKAGEIPPPSPFTGDDFSSGEGDEAESADSTEDADDPPAASVAGDSAEDLLAPVMALNEEERLALFT